MNVYTYSKARKKLASLLDEVREQGSAQIKRRNGETFIIKPVKEEKSSLDIPGVNSDLDLKQLNEAVRESRKRA